MVPAAYRPQRDPPLPLVISPHGRGVPARANVRIWDGMPGVGRFAVVNPAAHDDPGSPIYGMPIIEVERAKSVVVVKRSLSPGFAGIDNPLFYEENTSMLFADAKKALESISAAVKTV
jgi:hypothetical protein